MRGAATMRILLLGTVLALLIAVALCVGCRSADADTRDKSPGHGGGSGPGVECHVNAQLTTGNWRVRFETGTSTAKFCRPDTAHDGTSISFSGFTEWTKPELTFTETAKDITITGSGLRLHISKDSCLTDATIFYQPEGASLGCIGTFQQSLFEMSCPVIVYSDTELCNLFDPETVRMRVF